MGHMMQDGLLGILFSPFSPLPPTMQAAWVVVSLLAHAVLAVCAPHQPKPSTAVEQWEGWLEKPMGHQLDSPCLTHRLHMATYRCIFNNIFSKVEVVIGPSI